MRSETKCPKCGGFDGYEQIKNVVRGAGWLVNGRDIRVLFCRNCDVEMITSKVITPETPREKMIRYLLIFGGLLIALILSIRNF